MHKLLLVSLVVLLYLQCFTAQEIFTDSVDITFIKICSKSTCYPIEGQVIDINGFPFDTFTLYGTFYNRTTTPAQFQITEDEALTPRIEYTIPAKKEKTFTIDLNAAKSKINFFAQSITPEKIGKKRLFIFIQKAIPTLQQDGVINACISIIAFIVMALVALILRHAAKVKYTPNRYENKLMQIGGAAFFTVFIIWFWILYSNTIYLPGLISIICVDMGLALLIFSLFYIISNKMIEQERNSSFLTLGIIAAIISFFVNTSIGALLTYFGSDLIVATYVAPLVEETSKGLLLIALLVIIRCESPAKGFFFGAITGLGFTILENIIYSLQYYQYGDVLSQLILALMRSSLPGHLFFTGLTGFLFIFYYSRLNNKYICAFAALGVGILLHGTFNALASFFPIALLLLVGILLFSTYLFTHADLNSQKL